MTTSTVTRCKPLSPVRGLCEITFARNNIPKDKLRPDEFLKWVPSGVGTLGELQVKGYGYIKVG